MAELETVEIIGQQVQTTAAPKPQTIEFQPKPVYDFFKRIFDIVVALICLTVGLPVYIIIAAAIMIDDFGNPFFVQERIGYKGKPFLMVKFRTMYAHSDEKKENLMPQNEYKSVHFKMQNDPRITIIVGRDCTVFEFTDRVYDSYRSQTFCTVRTRSAAT